jgi:Tfp pilus assembly protein PilF
MAKTTLLVKFGLILFGVVISLALIEFGLRVAGMIVSSPQEIRNTITGDVVGVDGLRTYRILAIGESTTAGGYYSWPSQLEILLNNRSSRRFKVYNEGIDGTNTAFILKRLNANLDRYNPDMVITMMGLNDDDLTFVYKTGADYQALLSELRLFKLWKWLISAYTQKYPQQQVQYSPNNQVDERCRNLSSLGLRDYQEGRKESAQELLKKVVLDCATDDNGVYFTIAMIYNEKGRPDEAKHFLQEAVRLNPDFFAPYAVLAWFDHENATRYLRKATELNPNYYQGYEGLLREYKSKGNRTAYEVLLKRLMASEQDSREKDYLLTRMARFYNSSMDSDSYILDYYRSLNFSLVDVSNREITRYHYREVYKVLHGRNITYLAMQYPTLGIDAIKSFFDGGEEIVFVSNKESFERALDTVRYDDLFTDEFGITRNSAFHGNFGHATIRGNHLIAENLASIILDYLQNASQKGIGVES